MINTLQEHFVEFKNVTGKDYQPQAFPNPQTTEPRLLKLVATIKVLSANQRELEILQETKSWPKVGFALVVSPENQQLVREMDELKVESNIWASHR